MFSTRKTLRYGLFSLNVCEATRITRALQARKRGEFWRETHTPLWLLIGRIFFLAVRDSDWTFLSLKNIAPLIG